jgi:hypothetical protein
MNHFFYATDSNVKRFRNLLETSVDETERRTLQKLLAEEEAAQTLHRSLAAKSNGQTRKGSW